MDYTVNGKKCHSTVALHGSPVGVVEGDGLWLEGTAEMHKNANFRFNAVEARM